MPQPQDIDAESSAIWHMILDAGLADETQLEEVWNEHERTGVAFNTALYNFGIVQEEQLLWMIADNLNTEYVDIKSLHLGDEFMHQFDKYVPVFKQYNILPIREEDGTLHVAAADALDIRLIDELHQVLDRPVEILVAKPDEISNAIEHFYPENITSSMNDLISDLDGAFDASEFDDTSKLTDAAIEEAANTTPIVRFVNVVLYQAVRDKASDIHFEPFADEFKIRYRVDGVLYEMSPPPKHLALPVISRVKVLSGLNIAERRLPQDGRIEIKVAGRKIDLRVSTLPTQYGESVVLRVLDKTVVQLDIEALGLPDLVKTQVRDAIAKPNGILLVTGPTGSGKTTTLYACLKELNSVEDKVMTAEDPVEYTIEGLIQLQMKESVGLTFARALRAFLRQDPDRIMVGEIRDLETATIAIQASLTGHLVLSTLHTNDAPSALTRLSDMGVEPFLITSTIEGVLAQRLVRKVCNYCKTQYQITEPELKALNLRREDIGEANLCVGAGCGECNNTGYKGRTGLFEFFRLSTATRGLIMKKEPASVIGGEARKEGMRSLREHGVEQILAGVTSVEEILKYT